MTLRKEDNFKVSKDHEETELKFKNMTLREEDKFQVSKNHEETEFKFKNVVGQNALIDNESVSPCHFQQGDLGNCGLAAALASMSLRREFLTEIAPSVHRTGNSVELHFNMYCEGRPVKVKVDDALPFDKNDGLIYSRSATNENLYLAAFFEKAYVKQVCNKSYDGCKSTTPTMVFSSFSDSMISSSLWEDKDSKCDLMQTLKSELDNKSSVVLSACPALESDAEEAEAGHNYCVMDYNEEHNAVKLYDAREDPEFPNESLPPSLAADASKGEFWTTVDRLEKRCVQLTSLHAKNRYRSCHRHEIKVEQACLEKETLTTSSVFKVQVKEPSTFMVNLFSYSYALDSVNMEVKLADGENSNVETNREWPDEAYLSRDLSEDNEGEITEEYYQRFKLQPNAYIFSFELVILKFTEPYFLYNKGYREGTIFPIKISSVSNCTFENARYGKKISFQDSC